MMADDVEKSKNCVHNLDFLLKFSFAQLYSLKKKIYI